MSRDSELREYIVFLAAFETAIEKMIDRTELQPDIKKRAKTAKTHASAIMCKLVEELPDSKKRALWNYANSVTLKAYPILSPESKRDYCVVESEALYKLAESACEMCLKDDKEAKRCERRKLLERCGVFGKVEGTACPFKLL